MPLFDTKKYLLRFLDTAEDAPSSKAPLQTFTKATTISLESAMQPIISLIPNIYSLVQQSRDAAKQKTSNILNQDQIAAIFLYTAQAETNEGSVFYQLNRALRADNKENLKPWYPYLTLLLGALALLPSKKGMVFRGMKMNAANMYSVGQVFIWWSFTSCTDNMGVLKDESFFGQKGKRAFFTIECHNGKDIRDFSFFRDEGEILLPPMQQYRVKAVLPQPEMMMIQLEETNAKSLLELLDEENRKVQPPLLQAVNPISRQPGRDSISFKRGFTQDIFRSCMICLGGGLNDHYNGSAGYTEVKSHRGHGFKCCKSIFCCPCKTCRKILKHS